MDLGHCAEGLSYAGGGQLHVGTPARDALTGQRGAAM